MFAALEPELTDCPPLLSDSGIIPTVIRIIWIICNRIEVSGEKLISVKIIE